jgi:hypothetical protein
VAFTGGVGVRLAPFCLAVLPCRFTHQQEIFNLKIDAIIAGLWIGVMGMNALPTAALVMMVGMNMMGSGAVVCLPGIA